MLGRPFYVHVDSDWADKGHTGDFYYGINLPSPENYDSVVLIQGSFPKSWYVVREGLNSFTLTESASSVQITIASGNYSMQAFRVALTLALNANSPNGYTYAISMPLVNNTVSTGKYTYTVTGNAGIQPVFTFPTTTLLHKQMGFVYNTSNAFVGDTLVSTNICNMNTVAGLLIKTDLIDGETTQSPTGSNVLQEVLCYNTNDFSNISFGNPAPDYSAKPLRTGVNQLVNFKITDLDDNTIDFNGMTCNFSLAFFKRDNYNELAVRDMKLRYMQDLFTENEQKNNGRR